MMWFFWLACATEVCEDTPTYKGWAEGFFLSRCMPCHAQDAHAQYDAPYIDLGSHQIALDNLEALRRTIIDDARMPPAGGLTAEEKELIELWLECPQ